MMDSIIAEKVEQAVGILNELGIDAWLTFVRETREGGDPILPLILGQDLTWQSALILTRTGERIAIVGKFEDGAVRSTGVWAEVIPYVQSVKEPLCIALKQIDPQKLAINYSRDDVLADGLAHGLFLLLNQHLADTPYVDRLVSASDLIGKLRGRKSPSEIGRIKQAIATTLQILDAVPEYAISGQTEREVAHAVHDRVHRHGVGFAWDPKQCPIVNTGPDSMIGHGLPSDIAIERGHILHFDFGVKQDDYCADLQRCWYVPRAGEAQPPEEVRQAFDTVVRAIQAAAKVLKPGVAGWEVDAAARKVVVDAGYTEYQHGTGHQVGRSAHDGAALLAPKWERYGELPLHHVEKGNVFTLELGIENIGDHGYLGLEEMVVVTEDGCEFLSKPQSTLPLLK